MPISCRKSHYIHNLWCCRKNMPIAVCFFTFDIILPLNSLHHNPAVSRLWTWIPSPHLVREANEDFQPLTWQWPMMTDVSVYVWGYTNYVMPIIRLTVWRRANRFLLNTKDRNLTVWNVGHIPNWLEVAQPTLPISSATVVHTTGLMHSNKQTNYVYMFFYPHLGYFYHWLTKT